MSELVKLCQVTGILADHATLEMQKENEALRLQAQKLNDELEIITHNLVQVRTKDGLVLAQGQLNNVLTNRVYQNEDQTHDEWVSMQNVRMCTPGQFGDLTVRVGKYKFTVDKDVTERYTLQGGNPNVITWVEAMQDADTGYEARLVVEFGANFLRPHQEPARRFDPMDIEETDTFFTPPSSMALEPFFDPVETSHALGQMRPSIQIEPPVEILPNDPRRIAPDAIISILKVIVSDGKVGASTSPSARDRGSRHFSAL